MKITLHERDRGVLPKNKLYFTSFRLPLAVAQGIDVRAQKVSKDTDTTVSYSEAIAQVLEQFVKGTPTPKGIKSKLKASKHARDAYEKPKAKAKSAKKTTLSKAAKRRSAQITAKAKAKKSGGIKAAKLATKAAKLAAKKPAKKHIVKTKAPKATPIETKAETAPETVANGVAETPAEAATAT